MSLLLNSEHCAARGCSWANVAQIARVDYRGASGPARCNSILSLRLLRRTS